MEIQVVPFPSKKNKTCEKRPKKKRNLFICKQNRAKMSCHQMWNQQQSTYGPYYPSCRAPE